MSSNSLRSMYKARLKEENTTSTRRRSRGIERKRNRDDTVNKLRHLSSDEMSMSPLTESEPEDDQPEMKSKRPAPHQQRVMTRLERLKLWREERKRKQEEEKRNNKKPTFRVTKLSYSGESELYKKEMKEKPGTRKPKTDTAVNPVAPAVTRASTKSSKQQEPKAKLTEKENRKQMHSTHAPRTTRATNSKAKAPAPAPSSKTTRQVATSKPTVAKPSTVAQPNTRQRGNNPDLYTKLTASAAAKFKSQDKPKEYLRAKPHGVTRSSTRSQKTATENLNADPKTKQGRMTKEEIGEGSSAAADVVLDTQKSDDDVKTDEPIVDVPVPAQVPTAAEVADSDHSESAEVTDEQEHSASSSDSKELHLSDSTVSTPKHSTPGATRKSSLKKRSASACEPDENTKNLGRRRSGRSRKSRASTRRSIRNLSVINAAEVALAFKGISEPSLLTAEEKPSPTLDSGVVQEEISKSKKERRSKRNVSLINAEDIALAFKEICMPSLAPTEDKPSSALENDAEREEKLRSKRGRKSKRNMSLINATDVALAFKEICEPGLAPMEEKSSPTLLNDIGQEGQLKNKKRRSKRNLSMINSEDVAMAFKGMHEPNLSVPEENLSPSLNDVEKEDNSISNNEHNSEILNKELPVREETPKEVKTCFIKVYSGRRSRKSQVPVDTSGVQDSSRGDSLDTSSSMMNEVYTELNPLEMSNKENVNDEEISLRKDLFKKSLGRKSESTDVFEQGRSQGLNATEDETNHGGKEINDEQQTTPSSSRASSSPRSMSSTRRRSRRLVFSTEEEAAPTFEEVASPAKRTRRSVASAYSTNEAHPMKEDSSENDAAAHAFPTPVSQQRVRMGSAVTKRKSVRIAVDSSSGDETAEREVERATSGRKARKSIQRQCTPARRKSASRRSRRSTVVSVSGEGTSNVIGDDVVEEVKMPVTPRHDQLLQTVNRTPGRSSNKRRSTRRSQVIDVSDEGTSCDGSIVYQVGKPTDEEPSSRALQELPVNKVEGQISFLEISVDEDMDTVEAQRSCTSPVTKSGLSASAVDESQSPQAVTEDSDLSTQPFTPRRSHDVTKITISSTQSSPSADKSPGPAVADVTTAPPTSASPSQNLLQPTTPRSSRRRGRSMAHSAAFKTPGQPVSALRPRSERRRKTESSTPSRSPEEMIEILKKSPMVEMTRRRSRHISSIGSATMPVGPTNMNILFTDASLNKQNSNTSAPALMETMPISTQDLSTNDTNVLATTTTMVSSPQCVEDLQLNSQVAERVRYFRGLLTSETNRLNELCNKWTEISNYTFGLGEDILGQIRSTVGKAQLLMDQRFKQFSGLVDNCEFGLGEKETTPTDLQGFWDMVYFQVQDVDQLFTELSELQQNNWQVKQPSPAKNVPKPKQKKEAVKISKPKVKSNFAAFREELMKRKAQAALAKTKGAVSSQEDDETKIFDAGFFKVTSPVRSPSGRRSQSNTPLKPTVTETGTAAKEEVDSNVTKIVPNLASESGKPSTPVTHGNKENEIVSTPQHGRLISMTGKRLSYVPAVPSPLLNDITGLRPKKS